MKSILTTLALTLCVCVNAQIKLVKTIGGGATSGFMNGYFNTSLFNAPHGIVVDASGNVIVADLSNRKIRKISPTGYVTTLAGTGVSGYTDGPALTAEFGAPRGMAIDANGDIIIADGCKIRKLTSAGTVTTIAGTNTPGYADGLASVAQFTNNFGIAINSVGDIIVVDGSGPFSGSRIRKVSATGIVSTIAGTGTIGYVDGASNFAQFSNPYGVAVNSIDEIFVADGGNNVIRKINASGNVSTFAGNPSSSIFTDGLITTATFNLPQYLFIDAMDNIYIADRYYNRIRKISTTSMVSTIAGNTYSGDLDGPTSLASLDRPTGICLDANGVIYFTENSPNKVRKIETASCYVTTLPCTNTVTLRGIVNRGGFSTNTSFEYGTTLSYGASITATPSIITSNTTDTIKADISTIYPTLLPSTVYHYRAVGVNNIGTAYGPDFTFTTSAITTNLHLQQSPTSISISPNPTNSNINITISNATNIKHTLCINDVLGKVLIQQVFEGAQQTIDVSHLSAGVYYVSITNENNERVVQKIIKE